MSHRNNNLVFTSNDIIKNTNTTIKRKENNDMTDLNPSKKIKENNNTITNTDISLQSNKKDDIIENQVTKKSLSEKSISEDNSSDSNEYSISSDSNDSSISSDFSDNSSDSSNNSNNKSSGSISESDNIPVIKKLLSDIYDSDKTDDDEILKRLENEDWYNELFDDDKIYYIEKMRQLITYKKPIPTLKGIMNLDDNIGIDHIKILVNDRLELNKIDRLSPKYNISCHNFLKKFNYFTDENNIDKHKNIRKIETEILKQPKFSESMRERILDSDFDIKIKSLIYEAYLSDMDSKKREKWLNIILELPHHPKKITFDGTVQNEAISSLVKKIMIQFDKEIYGMQEAKEEFICFITNIIANPKCKNKAIGMCGLPGVGKTMIAKIVATALELPIEQIALGGVTDSSFLEGHSYTYIGSEPGCIVKAISKMKYTNGIIFLDEIDKISKTHHGKEIEHSLLHIIDFTQNHDFRDKYIPEIPINLSNYIFVYSMNSTEGMDSALLSRIPIIKIEGYNKKEKLTIITDYILPEILQNYDMKRTDIIIPPPILDYLINVVKEEDEHDEKSGVRGLKKAINRIVGRINLYKLAAINGKMAVKLSFDIPNFDIPYTLTFDIVQKILASTIKTSTIKHNIYI